MTVDLNLPPFGLDCREWLVATEAEGLLVEQTDGAPIVAVLSTAVIVGLDLISARAVLSLALLDADESHELDLRDREPHHSDHRRAGYREAVSSPDALAADDPFLGAVGGQDICVLEAQWSEGYARFAVPAPTGGLAVVAEFSSAPNPSPELIDRFYDLVTSFRWAD